MLNFEETITHLLGIPCRTAHFLISALWASMLCSPDLNGGSSVVLTLGICLYWFLLLECRRQMGSWNALLGPLARRSLPGIGMLLAVVTSGLVTIATALRAVDLIPS